MRKARRLTLSNSPETVSGKKSILPFPGARVVHPTRGNGIVMREWGVWTACMNCFAPSDECSCPDQTRQVISGRGVFDVRFGRHVHAVNQTRIGFEPVRYKTRGGNQGRFSRKRATNAAVKAITRELNRIKGATPEKLERRASLYLLAERERERVQNSSTSKSST